MLKTSKYRRLKFVSMLIFSVISFAINLNSQTYFLENKGRLPSFVQYSAETSGGIIYFNKNGYTVLMKDTRMYDSLWAHIHKYKSLQYNFSVNWHRFDVEFAGANLADIKTKNQSITKYNFYKGNLPAKWHTNLKSFESITYQNIYPSIDWRIESLLQTVKHSFILKPGSDPNNIKINYSHTEAMRIEKGNLIISSSVGQIIEQKPLAYQIINNDTVLVECNYVLKKNKQKFELSYSLSEYNEAFELVIDPILVFSTYSGSQGDNFGFTATYDSKSHLYAGGIVDGGTGSNGGPFPVTPGAFQTVYAGGVGQAPANLPCDIGINKYDSAGTTLLYSTYLGGSRDEYPHSLVVDHQDNLLVMGTCYSPDFPTDTSGFDVTHNGGTDIFVTKLSEDGSSLLAGTLIGGPGNDGLNTNSLRYNYSDDFRGDIAVDTANNVYIASTTNSNSFPISKAIQMARASAQDGCIFSLDKQLSALRFSTYFGGNGDDAMYSIRLYDTFVYIGGGTSSTAMSFAVNGYQNNYNGGKADGFIAKLSLKGKLINSTYLGTGSYDQVYFLDIDASGQVYAAGQTEGYILRTAKTYGKDKTGQFILRLSPNISVMNLSTTFGNRTFDPEIAPSAFLVDKCDNIYFSGWGSPIDINGLHSLTTQGLQISSDAIQKTTDNNDFYILVLSKNASSLLFASYYGGNLTEDHVDGGTSRFDKKGVVYQSVCSSCPEPGNHYDDFPISNKAPFKKNLSPRCSNASFKIDFQINFEVNAKFTANPTSGCEDLRVVFTNQSRKANKFFWDFGDGSPIDTSKNPIHTYTNPGVYKVKLSSIDSFSCNISAFDSTYITVKEMPTADYEFETEECSNEFTFKNKSKDYDSSKWDFGDSSIINTDKNPKHRFYKDGIYKVLLTVTHPSSSCIDTQVLQLSLFSNPSSTIKIPNVFTPNSDNTNDCYTIGGITPNCDEAEIWIYNRWGILVFNGVLPDGCWNGRLKNNGDMLPDGTYYYILKLKSKNSDVKSDDKIEGVIRIIR